MYTDITKLKQTEISIPKGTQFYLFNDGRLGIYTWESLNIYNMLTFKVDLTIDEKTFPNEKEGIPDWGELVCLTELKNGYLVLGFGRALDFTNLIIDIKGNNPKIIKKFGINNANFCCSRIINFHFIDKDYFIAGDLNPQIYKAEQPFNEVATLDINLREMIQINGSNSLCFIDGNNFGIIDLTDIEKNQERKEVINISFDIDENYHELLQTDEEIIVLGKNVIQFINKKNYENKYMLLNKEFYSVDVFNNICLLFNGQLLAWSSKGELIKIDINKKEILQNIFIKPKAGFYSWQLFAYKDKYLIFANEDKLYEIKYDEKNEIKNFEEKKYNKTVEDFIKEQDDIVKKIIEEKDLKESDNRAFCRPPYVFYDIYRFKSLKKEFPMLKDDEISNLSMKEYENLKPENQKFFQVLAGNDKKIPSFIKKMK